jgi:predicted transcriptional regulator
MPGSRLTQPERRRIEAALGAGLRYAHISRELGRPTSTISREVARNGGRAGYRADHAQRATDWRAHRSARQAPRPTGERDEEFAAEFVKVMVRTGLPSMAARALVRLMITDAGALTGAELAAQLRVSRASVSKAVAYLETLAMLRRERPAGHRQERYVLDDDVWLHTWADNTRTNTMWADIARRGSELLDRDTPVGARLHDIAVFFTDLNGYMSGSPAAASVTDAVTIASALAHCGGALSARQLATALRWPGARVHQALEAAAAYPAITGPLTVNRDGDGRLTVAAKLERLTSAQLEALSAVSPAAPGAHRAPRPTTPRARTAANRSR